GHVGRDRDAIARDLDDALSDGEELVAVGRARDDLAGDDAGQHGQMTREDADHVEVVLANAVVSALEDLLEAAKPRTVASTATRRPSWPVNDSAALNGWLKNRWIFRARKTVTLSSGASSSMPRIAMMPYASPTRAARSSSRLCR